MPDVTEATAEVGRMILHALQNTFGQGSDAALAEAKAATGVSDETVDSADMGQVFDFMTAQPGLSPEVLTFLNTTSSDFNRFGNVDQSGNSFNGFSGGASGSGSGFSGGGSGGSGGAGGSGGSSSNAQLVQQVTQNFSSQEFNDNGIDILGPVNGDIDIDQDNDVTDIAGDGNAVNTGDGDQNAATGDGASAAQSDFGDAVSNSGDGAVTAGDDIDLENSAVGDGNTIIDDVDGNVATDDSSILDNEGGNIAAGDGGIVDNQGAIIEDSSLGFGEGNVQGDVSNEAGAANSQDGDATGQSVDVDTRVEDNSIENNSVVEDNDGNTVLNDNDGNIVAAVPADDAPPEHTEIDHGDVNNQSSPVEVNVEGGDGDQVVDDALDN